MKKRNIYTYICIILLLAQAITLTVICYIDYQKPITDDIFGKSFDVALYLMFGGTALFSEASFMLGLKSIIFDRKNNSIFKKILSISILPISLISCICLLMASSDSVFISLICNLVLFIEDILLIAIKNKTHNVETEQIV